MNCKVSTLLIGWTRSSKPSSIILFVSNKGSMKVNPFLHPKYTPPPQLTSVQKSMRILFVSNKHLPEDFRSSLGQKQRSTPSDFSVINLFESNNIWFWFAHINYFSYICIHKKTFRVFLAFWGLGLACEGQPYFFYLSATDRLWLTLGQPRLVVSPVSLFESNKESMEVTWDSKSSPPCHRRDQVLFESNNNLSNQKCPCHGKAPFVIMYKFLFESNKLYTSPSWCPDAMSKHIKIKNPAAEISTA